MPRTYRWSFLALVAVLACVGICCRNSRDHAASTSDDRSVPPTGNATPAKQPAAENPTPADSDKAAEPPRIEAAAPTPAHDEKPKLPDYVRVLESSDATRNTNVAASLPGSGVVNLQTTNVRRLQLKREALPFTASGSIAVRIDGQGIEWQQKYPLLELELLQNGSWEIVRQPAPVRP